MGKFNDDWLLELIEEIIKNDKITQLDISELGNIITDVILKNLPVMAKDIARSLKERSHVMLTEHRLLRYEFNSRLEFKWFESLDLVEMIIVGLSELGEEVNTEIRQAPHNHNKCLSEVLARFHARGIRIAYEILCLLRNGYADGAFARWRSLHELAAYSFFIVKHGEEVAERYMEYSDIETYFEADLYQKHAETLGYEQLTSEELQQILNRKEQLISKHSEDFAQPYGWTLNILPKKKRNFKGIEEDIDLSHLRPFYAMACRSLHSTSKGLQWDMGLLDDKRNDILLAGSSNYGLADPSQNTGISLLQITLNFVLLKPTVDRIAALDAISILINEMADKCVKIQKQIEDDVEKNLS